MGSDVAAETAAALAVGSIVFRDADPVYSQCFLYQDSSSLRVPLLLRLRRVTRRAAVGGGVAAQGVAEEGVPRKMPSTRQCSSEFACYRG
ncbi:Endoglucanase 6 [Hordeum vulgare]|nr:Endoglucanase 6 [Hordeum vulgare]